MNFLSSYGDGSDSDSDCCETNEIGKVVPNIETESASSTATTVVSNKFYNPSVIKDVSPGIANESGKLKRKLFDISILPAHIQSALNHGDSLLDSDASESDDDRGTVKRATYVKGKDLVTQLPAPKDDVTRAPISVTGNNDESDSRKPALHAGYDHAIDKAYGGNIPRNINSCPMPSNAHISFSSSSTTAPPSVVRDIDDGGQEAVSTDISSSHRRGRDMERALLSGNKDEFRRASNTLNVIDIGNGSSGGPGGWNSGVYLMQQKREEELKANFTVNQSSSLNTLNPSKQQSRKHQINSLAVAAADMELKLLEAQGKRNKSKSETQGKYGW